MLVANTNTHFLEQKEDLKKGIHKKTLKTATLMTDNNLNYSNKVLNINLQ